MTRLSLLVDRARAARVSPEDARAYVGELARWARVEPARPRRAWSWWLGGGAALAAAAAAALVLLVVADRKPDGASAEVAHQTPLRPFDATPVRIGERVAIVAAPASVYAIATARGDETTIVVERGTVTARLWPGAQPHRLSLRGAGVEAVATGTVYSLRVDEHGASVEVHEGTVGVTHAGVHTAVPAGSMWPASARHREGELAARQLLALPAPAPAVAATSADETVVEPSPRPVAPSVAAPAPRSVAAKTLTDRWRSVRLLRGQGEFAAAIRECLVIADARDATWSPIALLEAARIELGPRAAPEQAIVLADRFEREWSTHALASLARDLRCRALRQLGRDGECTTESP